MDWTDHTLIQKLIDLWNWRDAQTGAKHSTAAIADKMGVTKNAIVGKAHRLGLEPRPSPIHRVPGAAPVRDRPPSPAYAPTTTLAPLESTQAVVYPAYDGARDRFGRPLIWAAWFESLPQPRRHALVNSEHQLACKTMRDAKYKRPWHCTCGVTRYPEGWEPPAKMMPAAQPAPAHVSVAAPPTQIVVRPPEPERRSLTPSIFRQPESCCWPIGNPGTRAFRYCDGASVPGKPYCEDHCKLGYSKTETARFDKRVTAKLGSLR
ncbi:MAG TPA: GcrA family cell cycle regulator [Acetobacteraceae bacterium]|nr:GcrA family cell cycle regulator [Acetobacteraceae bacterium]